MFCLILYIPVNNFSVMLGWVFLVCTSTKQRIKCLAQGHNTVTLPAIPSLTLYRLSHCSFIVCNKIRLSEDKDTIHPYKERKQKGPDKLWKSRTSLVWSCSLYADFMHLLYTYIQLKIYENLVSKFLYYYIKYCNYQFKNTSHYAKPLRLLVSEVNSSTLNCKRVHYVKKGS